ncbi:MAG: beta-lactamase family protein [Clostridiales bacterium]|nr:beta-lactamase family protein [Clostridiales bacterium]
MWKVVDDLLAQCILDGVFPGCAMAAGQGPRILYTGAYGHLDRAKTREVTHPTRYDVGSLTEILTTMPLLLIAVEQGMVSLDDPLTHFIDDVPHDKRKITLLHLLTHTSGISPYFLLQQEAKNPREAIDALIAHPLNNGTGSKVHTSSMGYLLLGLLLERIFQMPLDEAMKRYISSPMHLRRTGFLPSGADIAPTDNSIESEEWQAGLPNDENARFMHGVAGHAGLFTNLEDISRFTSMFACNGRCDDQVFFSSRAIHLATTERTRGMSDARGYGFQITKRSNPFLGHLWPSGGYGLSDHASGSLIAVSPDDGFFVTFLTNGRSTLEDRRDMQRIHKRLLNAAYAAFQHDI